MSNKEAAFKYQERMSTALSVVTTVRECVAITDQIQLVYNQWHSMADALSKVKIKQSRCAACGTYRFPKEQCPLFQKTPKILPKSQTPKCPKCKKKNMVVAFDDGSAMCGRCVNAKENE